MKLLKFTKDYLERRRVSKLQRELSSAIERAVQMEHAQHGPQQKRGDARSES